MTNLEAETRRQIGDFQDHGVHGFVLHLRVGLPRDLGWMSDALLAFYDVALNETAQRAVYVILYDEGMYPSGYNPSTAERQEIEPNQPFRLRGHELVVLLVEHAG